MTTTSLDRPQANTARKGVLVGLFVLIGLVVLAGGILTVGNLHSTFVRKITVTTSFSDVNGLQPGNNVWFSGLKVGTVNQLEFVGESQVRVSMKIDKATARFVHKDSVAKLSSDGLIGNKIVVLTSGTKEAANIEDGDVLQAGAAPSTDDMMAVLQQSNADLKSITTDMKAITAKVASGQGAVGRLLYDDELAQSLTSTTTSLARASENADKTTNALANYTNNLNKPGTLFHDLAHDKTVYPSLTKTSAGLEAASVDAASAAKNLRAATDDPNSPMGVLMHDPEAGADLKSTFDNLDTSTQKLDEDLEAAQHNFLLKHFFKKKAKEEAKAAEEAAPADDPAK
jgi:phospholipid/cholesterol/gamma-HCH transport system substrate-binding protein